MMLRTMPAVTRTAERRKAAIKLLKLDQPEKDRADALSVDQVADMFSVSREAVRKWVVRYETGGEKALASSDAHRGRYYAVSDKDARGLMAAARREKLETLTAILELAKRRGLETSRSGLRRKLIALALWP